MKKLLFLLLVPISLFAQTQLKNAINKFSGDIISDYNLCKQLDLLINDCFAIKTEIAAQWAEKENKKREAEYKKKKEKQISRSSYSSFSGGNSGGGGASSSW